MATKQRERKRVSTAKEAAEFLGLSSQRIHDMKNEAPWFTDDMKNDDGWDVIAMARAQQKNDDEREFAKRKPPKSTAEEKTKAAAELREAKEKANIKTLERRRLQRRELEEQKKIVAVDVVAALFTESLSDLRTRIVDEPYELNKIWPDLTEEDLQKPLDEINRQIRSLICSGHDFKKEEPPPESCLLETMVFFILEGHEEYWDGISNELFDREDDDGIGD